MVGRVGQVQAGLFRGKGHRGVTISDESRPPVSFTVGFATRDDARSATGLPYRSNAGRNAGGSRTR